MKIKGKGAKKISAPFLIIVAVVLVLFASVEWNMLATGGVNNADNSDMLAASATSGKVWPPINRVVANMKNGNNLCAISLLTEGRLIIDCATKMTTGGYTSLVEYACAPSGSDQICKSGTSVKSIKHVDITPTKCAKVCGAGTWK